MILLNVQKEKKSCNDKPPRNCNISEKWDEIFILYHMDISKAGGNLDQMGHKQVFS